MSWPCGEKCLIANLAFTLLQALTQVWQGLMLPEPCMGQLGSICLLKMFVGFGFVFLTLFFSFHSALTLVLHRRQAQINLLLSNFWPPWHEGICFLLEWRHALQMVCSALWTEEGCFLVGSGQAGPFCPVPPPPPLLTESATQLTLYLLSSTHFPKRKSEVL